MKVWCIQSLDKCLGFGVREDEHSWRFFVKHSRGMLGIAGESRISSLSQGCAVIFVKQKSSVDQSMWLQLPRYQVGTSATWESPWTGEFRSPGEHCWCPHGSHSSKGVITCVHNLYSPVYKSFSSLTKKPPPPPTKWTRWFHTLRLGLYKKACIYWAFIWYQTYSQKASITLSYLILI